MLVIIIALLAILVILVATLKPVQQPADQGKIASVPIEIKTQEQASTIEKDTSSMLQEVSGALNSIDSSLPDV